MQLRICRCRALLAFSLFTVGQCAARESIEFVAEHLPEAAVDNRYGTLPIWALSDSAHSGPTFDLQVAYGKTSSGDLRIEGPLLSFAGSDRLGEHWRWGAFAFYDPLRLEADRDDRPLETLFSPSTPIARPVGASFTNLDGRATDFGAGVFCTREQQHFAWTTGLLWQQVALEDYRFDYLVTEGPQSGIAGQIDFDTHYTHIAPFAGAQASREMGDLVFTAHALAVVPIPRRGVAGHITGPDFDLRGNTEDVGEGKHFGDPSLTLGLGILYEPAHLSVDAGLLVTQALLEKKIHRGIDQDYLLSLTWRY